MTRQPSTFKQRDMTRGLKAAKLAGIDVRVDVTRDGLRFTPMPAEAPVAAETNEWDRVLGKPPVRP